MVYSEERIASHDSGSSLLESIQAGIKTVGKTIDDVTVNDFAFLDELHTGGLQVVEQLVAQLGLSPDDRVLDIGCGLGGAARFVADQYGCRMTGIDLAEEYIRIGRAINRWVCLDDQIDLCLGSALALPFAAGNFDGGYMTHVGMNIADKPELFASIYRVLRADAPFGVYDFMKISDGELAYPVPWADVETMSTLGSTIEYEEALRSAGFEIVTVTDRRDDAFDFFEAHWDRFAAQRTPLPQSLHTLMEASVSVKVKNVIENIVSGLIAPVEIIAHKV